MMALRDNIKLRSVSYLNFNDHFRSHQNLSLLELATEVFLLIHMKHYITIYFVFFISLR